MIKDMFSAIFTEADDEPPDAAMGGGGTDPPEIDTGGDAPDLSDDGGAPPDLDGGDDGGFDDAGPPPDLGDDGFGSEADDGMSPDGESEDGDDKEDSKKMGIDDKVSIQLNAKLYPRFLSLLNNIGGQIASMKNNSDVLNSVAPEVAPEMSAELRKLEENVRIYLDQFFNKKNYSDNLLFFNKVLNQLKLLNEYLDSGIKAGNKDSK